MKLNETAELYCFISVRCIYVALNAPL